MAATEAGRRGRKRRVKVSLAVNDNLVVAERPEDVQAVVIAQRLRLGVPRETVRDQRAECFFGRMALWGWITQTQYEAGARYARTLSRRDRLDGLASPFPRGLDMEAGARGQVNRPEPEADEIDRIKSDYHDMLRALSDLEHAASYRNVSRLLKSVIVMDRPFEEADAITRRQLKAGLNVLARLWGMGE